ncbi:glucose-6-phosphate isomerase [uncultured Veillonella sp.]|uniref:glucose-6-phosphate isomerase n=1 Tax=uncultured Veillonella sp. TaxID=159268 RepID=UPI0025FD590A|nr:glucose-6-phosphate isomerase [uncultured Veillonella sp.]MDY3974086.1 glucose-6-phosphate isomerase [Veillonella caviae]
MSKIVLPSGFTFDYTNVLNEWAVTDEDMRNEFDNVANAVKAAAKVRFNGVVDGHLSKDGTPEKVLFPELPYVEDDHLNSEAVLKRLEALGAHAKESIDAVVSFGIGGSYLGGKVLFDVHCGEFWNQKTAEQRNGYPQLYFSGNNADSKRTKELIDALKDSAARKESDFKVMLIVISKSGSTIEPMSNFMVVQEAMLQAGIGVEVIAVTDPRDDEKETLLHKLAVSQNWPIFAVPDGVGGRFSVFTEVGLIIGAVIGFDIRSFLDGAKEIDQACKSGNMLQNPALLSAILKYIASEKYGRTIEVMMPYGDSLKSLAEWYVQLLAESLGKEKADKSGRYGRTPVVAVGTTDMHAQTQEHQEGRLNKVVTFVKVADWETELVVPHTYADIPTLEAFSGLDLATIMNTALEANSEALTGDKRFNLTIELPTLNAFFLGAFMFMQCWAIFYEGQLANVDAFNQPGVEVYKKLLGPKLAAHKNK